MNPIEWLEGTIPEFANLPNEDRDAIFHFTLLWSLFEVKAIGTMASSKDILALVHSRRASLDVTAFDQCLQYFRKRYYSDGEFTSQFHKLNLRRNDFPELVKEILQSISNDPADSITALLIVVYRLRNNLFHGTRWKYELQGQRKNFDAANAAIMAAYTQLV